MSKDMSWQVCGIHKMHKFCTVQFSLKMRICIIMLQLTQFCKQKQSLITPGVFKETMITVQFKLKCTKGRSLTEHERWASI